MHALRQHPRSYDARLRGARRGDEGGIVIGWLTKLLVIFAILGVLGFDAVSIGVTHLTAQDDADAAVQAASENFQTTHDATAALQAAQKAVNSREIVNSVQVQPDGTATVSMTEDVRTLVLQRIKQAHSLLEVTVKASGKYNPS